jgi:hypothetical protein
VEKIHRSDAERVFDALEQLVSSELGRHAYYEDAYHALLSGGWELGSHDIGDSEWIEIDDASDMNRAAALLQRLGS